MPPKSKNKKETSKISLGPLTQSFNKVRAGQQALRKDTAQASRLWSFRRDDVRQGGTTGKPAMDWLLQAFESTSVPQLVQSDGVGALSDLLKLVKSHQGKLIAVATIVTTQYDDRGEVFNWGYNAACGVISGALQFPTPDGFSARLTIPVTSLHSDHRGIDQEIAQYDRGKSGSIHLSSHLLFGEDAWTTGRHYQHANIAIIGKTAIQQWAQENRAQQRLSEVADNFADWADDIK